MLKSEHISMHTISKLTILCKFVRFQAVLKAAAQGCSPEPAESPKPWGHHGVKPVGPSRGGGNGQSAAESLQICMKSECVYIDLVP